MITTKRMGGESDMKLIKRYKENNFRFFPLFQFAAMECCVTLSVNKSEGNKEDLMKSLTGSGWGLITNL